MVKTRAQSGKASFWSTLPKPFFVLAPMANVTDSVFRAMIAKYGKPDVTWTEFVSADGLCSSGKKKLLLDLVFSDKERPIVAQLFTGNPASMEKAAQLCAGLGFDGIDINMGCPDRAVEKQGGGSAMIKDPKRAIEVLNAAREGWKKKFKVQSAKFKVGQNKSVFDIPVSVKTRIGYNAVDWAWIRLLLEQQLPALTIHLRTRKEMSEVPAHWELMPEIVKMRNDVQQDISIPERTLIIGNGDVQSIEEATDKCEKYGCDGVMIGRGIFGRPWLFEDKIKNQKSKVKNEKFKTPEERLKVMLEHTKLFEKTYCLRKKLKNFAVMKKHFKAYVSGWDGAKELRVKLMETDNYKEVKTIVDQHLQGHRRPE